MSGLLPFAGKPHQVWSPFAVKIHAAAWDRVGLERVQEYVRQWAAEWKESQARYASQVEELRPDDPSCRSPEAPTLPLPSPDCERTPAEKWALLAAVHDAYWLDADKINPFPEPANQQDLEAGTAWVTAGGFVYRQILERVLKLAEVDLALAKSQQCVLERWLEDLASTGDNPDFRHSDDFRSVVWSGTSYTFTKNQAACVKVLWEAWEAGTPELDGLTVVTQADVAQARLLDVFRSTGKPHAAWGSMLTQGQSKGAYRLNDKPAVAPVKAHR